MQTTATKTPRMNSKSLMYEQFLTRGYVRYRGISKHRFIAVVSNHRSGGCDSDGKAQK